jgi:cytochrome P450
MISFEILSVCVAAVSLLFAAVLVRAMTNVRHKQMPLSTPHFPLLGNALSYDSDAAGFVRRNAERVGRCFRLNLAGFRLTLLGDDHALRKYYRCSESVLSSYRALQAVGFDVALGRFNLFDAPQMHRKLLRELSEPQFVERFDAAFARLVRQTRDAGAPIDFMPTVRHWFFVASVAALLGPEFLTDVDVDVERFAARFLAWQDGNEAATAKAFVAPSFARYWIMSPVARGRVQLRDWITPYVARRRAKRTSSETRDFLDCLLDALPDDSVSNVADCVIGLLTAGPKNVSISFANMLMMLHAEATHEHRVRFRRDATTDVPSSTSFVMQCWSATLRLTNLVIGSLRVATEPVEFETERGEKFTAQPGELVGASHLLRSCATERSFADALRDPASVETHAFSAGAHACPGARLAGRMVEAAARAWCSADIELRGADGVAAPPPQPALCFRKATLAQRGAPWIVQLK